MSLSDRAKEWSEYSPKIGLKMDFLSVDGGEYRMYRLSEICCVSAV